MNATYDNSTGGVTFTAMPTSLTNGQTLAVEGSYTAPANPGTSVTSSTTPGQLMVESVVPPGFTVYNTSPPALVDTVSGAPTLVN